MIDTSFHEQFMREALREADKAAQLGEVPTGCVIVSRESMQIIARAHNQTETLKNPAAHAEMIAITQAAAHRGDWRLNDTILYVTKEPCAMCAGAIVLARVSLVVCGFSDPKRGGISLFNITGHPNLNHQPEILFDILRDDCLASFQSFFQACRNPDADRPAKPADGGRETGVKG